MSTTENSRTEYDIDELMCPIRYLISIVGGKWKQPIICMLSQKEPARYSTLKRKLRGITNMMLSQSLKELEASGIVHREQYNEVPPRVEYTLTKKGESLVPLLGQIGAWAHENMRNEGICGPYCEKCQQTK